MLMMGIRNTSNAGPYENTGERNTSEENIGSNTPFSVPVASKNYWSVLLCCEEDPDIDTAANSNEIPYHTDTFLNMRDGIVAANQRAADSGMAQGVGVEAACPSDNSARSSVNARDQLVSGSKTILRARKPDHMKLCLVLWSMITNFPFSYS